MALLARLRVRQSKVLPDPPWVHKCIMDCQEDRRPKELQGPSSRAARTWTSRTPRRANDERAAILEAARQSRVDKSGDICYQIRS